MQEKKMEELKKCPFCGSDSGYYMMETVYRGLFFDYDDTPIGASEDVTVYSGKRRRCIDCDKILPRKMFDEKGEWKNERNTF